MRAIVVLLASGMLLSSMVQAEEALQVKQQAVSLFIYEPFTITYSIEAEEPLTLPSPPPLPGFLLSRVDSFSLPTKTDKHLQQLQIELIPEQAGMLTLPPLALQLGDQTLTSVPRRLLIAAPHRADNMTLTLSFAAPAAVLGQPLRMSVRWSSKTPFVQCKELGLHIPLLDHPDWTAYPIEPAVPEERRMGLPVNSQRVIGARSRDESGEHLEFTYMMVPKNVGRYEARGALHCALLKQPGSSNKYPSYFDNHLFHKPNPEEAFERVFCQAGATELTIRALPDAGRNAYFHGLVSRCEARAEIEPATCLVGQAIHLKVILEGITFGAHLPELPDVSMDALEPDFRISREPIEVIHSENTRTAVYIVRPLHTGITQVPALALQVFEPEAAAYRMVRTTPLPLTVQPDGKQTLFLPNEAAKQAFKKPLPGIRQNRQTRSWKQPMNTLLHTASTYWWIFWFAPPLLWLALRPWIKHRDRCRNDPVYARASAAFKTFTKAYGQQEETAWLDYLADRFNMPRESLTRASLERELKQRNLEPELVEAVTRQFAEQDAAHYAREGSGRPPVQTLPQLVNRLEQATRCLILVLCLIPCTDSRAERPATLFERAMEQRLEKPDEARLLFVEAALGYEKEGNPLNAANSWNFAGEAGRALGNFRQAERLEPLNRQIQESMAFIRSQRSDQFEGNDTSKNPLAYAWNRLMCWQPTLRFGLLTLGYVIFCALHTLWRIRGAPRPRALRFVFGLPAAALVVSLGLSRLSAPGGVLLESSNARLGPGFAYEAAYDSILHEASEFKILGQRSGWVQIALPDKQQAWVQETAVMRVP